MFKHGKVVGTTSFRLPGSGEASRDAQGCAHPMAIPQRRARTVGRGRRRVGDAFGGSSTRAEGDIRICSQIHSPRLKTSEHEKMGRRHLGQSIADNPERSPPRSCHGGLKRAGTLAHERW